MLQWCPHFAEKPAPRAYCFFFLAAERSFSILYEFSVIRGLALQIDDGFLTLLQSMLYAD